MNNIVIYGTEGCSKCNITKKLLDAKNIRYEYILIEDLDKLEREKILELAEKNSIQNFPIILKNNQIIKVEEI